MKKPFHVLILFVLSSCTTIYAGSSFVDFTKYKSFYMSQSPSADFKYKPLGIVSSFVRTGYRSLNYSRKSGKMKSVDDDLYSNSIQKPGGKHQATAQDAVDVLYEKSLQLGATGILNIQITYIPGRDNYGYSATGMAIKAE